ncbi:hypothetical protein BURMUCGD2M_6562 [Burkholderia multivorans CGD2M]|uniref:Uncharacterized protein n=1 Tax=Burkholderia multivorans CGD2 TaxID=513052 RepID=B9BPF1_9BURK|nr:hypothetical protein BURMUCGD2_6572 [Burkholderia multivorans CGD2]EEE13840.1 hypothetical protein BURMUCGD2M_6562 [Burkholderia multivorans CGD2M]
MRRRKRRRCCSGGMHAYASPGLGYAQSLVGVRIGQPYRDALSTFYPRELRL